MLIQEEFSEKFKKLPQNIQEIMLSSQTGDINWEIAKKYKLSDEQTVEMVGIIVDTILKDIPLEKFIVSLQQKLGLNDQIARQMALDIAQKRFLPLKTYLPGVETLIQNLGGAVPKSSPSTASLSRNGNIVDLKNLNRE